MDFKLMATGVGSLPHANPVEALELIFETLENIPHWPQLPKASAGEGFASQFLGPLLSMGLINEDACFNSAKSDWFEVLTRFYQIYLAAESGSDDALQQFGFKKNQAVGFYYFLDEISKGRSAVIVKGQLSGPLSVGVSVKDHQGKPAFYDEELRSVIVKTLRLNARWQARKLRASGCKVMLFVDEPMLYAYGQSAFVTLNQDTIVSAIKEVAEGARGEGAFVGLHVCSAADWSTAFASDVDVINFDAYQYFPSMLGYVDHLRRFMERGGHVAWGIVPASEEIFKETVDSLCSRLEKIWDKLCSQIPLQLLTRRSLLTPTCGCGSLSVQAARQVYLVLTKLEAVLRGKWFDS